MGTQAELGTDVEIVMGSIKLMLAGLTPRERKEVINQLQCLIKETHTNPEALIWL
jgi:hypothetical protein